MPIATPRTRIAMPRYSAGKITDWVPARNPWRSHARLVNIDRDQEVGRYRECIGLEGEDGPSERFDQTAMRDVQLLERHLISGAEKISDFRVRAVRRFIGNRRTAREIPDELF